MWTATALLRDGTQRPIEMREVETNGPFSSGRALDTLGQMPGVGTHLLDLVRAEQQDPRLTFSAIETWAEAAEREAKELDWAGAPDLRRVEEALAWYRPVGRAGESSRPSSVAWHDRTGVALLLTGEEESVTIEYVPAREDEHRDFRLSHRYASAGHNVETFFDWRGYFGKQTGIFDGWAKMHRRGRGLVTTIKGAAGILVGTVLRRATLPEPTLESDPRMKSRLAEMELRYRHIADSCPNLAELERVDHDRAMVFVHGTASCGIAGLRDLFSLAVDYWPVPGHVYRFEHDTFIPIIENSKQLASLIQKSIKCKQLLLVAHSRGGLVAVEAARYLADTNYTGKIEVQTFGTPFRGTPLVAIGQKVVNLFMKLGEEIASAVPVPVLSALAKGFFYLVEAPKLPAGIAAMHTQAPDMPYREQLIDKGALKAWGSDFDIESGSPGFGATVEGILLGALGKERHDLVVPMASAMAFSPCQPVLQCSHVHYFRQPAVQQAINMFLANAPADEPSSVVPAAPVQPDQAAVAAAIKRKSKELHDRLRKG